MGLSELGNIVWAAVHQALPDKLNVKMPVPLWPRRADHRHRRVIFCIVSSVTKGMPHVCHPTSLARFLSETTFLSPQESRKTFLDYLTTLEAQGSSSPCAGFKDLLTIPELSLLASSLGDTAETQDDLEEMIGNFALHCERYKILTSHVCKAAGRLDSTRVARAKKAEQDQAKEEAAKVLRALRFASQTPLNLNPHLHPSSSNRFFLLAGRLGPIIRISLAATVCFLSQLRCVFSRGLACVRSSSRSS